MAEEITVVRTEKVVVPEATDECLVELGWTRGYAGTTDEEGEELEPSVLPVCKVTLRTPHGIRTWDAEDVAKGSAKVAAQIRDLCLAQWRSEVMAMDEKAALAEAALAAR